MFYFKETNSVSQTPQGAPEVAQRDETEVLRETHEGNQLLANILFYQRDQTSIVVSPGHTEEEEEEEEEKVKMGFQHYLLGTGQI